MSQVRVRIDADLTDNVIATVRLINERIWNGQNDTAASGSGDISLDLAYVTLKGIPLFSFKSNYWSSNIRFGNGFIIGNAKVLGTSTSIPTDLTERKALMLFAPP